MNWVCTSSWQDSLKEEESVHLLTACGNKPVRACKVFKIRSLSLFSQIHELCKKRKGQGGWGGRKCGCTCKFGLAQELGSPRDFRSVPFCAIFEFHCGFSP